MKHLLLLFALAISSKNLFSQAPKIDTSYIDLWDGVSWEKNSRDITNYDANCQAISLVRQQWNQATQSWVNSSLTTYTYAKPDLLSEWIDQQWNSSTNAWENSSKTKFTYDASFKVLTFSSESWMLNVWQTIILSSYKYDNNGYVDSVITQTGFSGPLQNSALAINTNNNDGTVNQALNKVWNAGTSLWVNNQKSNYTYNAGKSIRQVVSRIWDTVSKSWKNSGRASYTYNASGKPLTTLTETWQTNQWVNDLTTIYTYDNDLIANTLTQRWNISNGIWDNLTQSDNTYNADGSIQQIISQKWNSATTMWDNNARQTLSYTSCTLPLTLLNFTASRNNDVISLTWQTSNEVNTSHFNIQRSTDGVNFTNAGNVTARGHSTLTNNYSFIDDAKKINGDKVYYRLQMVDKDGKYSFSKIVPITLLAYTGNIKTYPNPVKDQLYILFNIQSSSKAELRITDATGKTVRSQHVDAAQNNSAIGVNVATLGKGVYYVVLITDNGIQKTQFVKQ